MNRIQHSILTLVTTTATLTAAAAENQPPEPRLTELDRLIAASPDNSNLYQRRGVLRFFANDDALSLATRGLVWAEQLPEVERVRLTLELRDVALAAAPLDDWETAAKEYVALAEQALDHGALAHARLGYTMASNVRWAHGQWSAARRESLQAERVARGGSEEDHIVAMAETAKCLAMLERDLSQADAIHEEEQDKSVVHEAE